MRATTTLLALAPQRTSASTTSEAGLTDGAPTTDGAADGTRADDGCDCRIAVTTPPLSLPLLALLTLLLIFRRRS